ncbi:hypothetical protein M3Y97_00476400 [Aphelenchoides bicaudatus]|nr:hypothetical protein M3Y97_00476400 [Aphelenchoides bicaudatus]
MSRNSVNLNQLFWAKKTIRAEPLTILGFLACYFLLMFAVAMQKLWLFGAYTGICVIYGFMFFVLHTYCYEETAEKMYKWSHLCFYKPCAKIIKSHRPKTPKHRLLALKHKEDLVAGNATMDGVPLGPAPNIKLIEPSPAPIPANVVSESLPPAAKESGSSELPPMEPNDANSQDFYKWLTDSNEGNMAHAENVLFQGNAPPAQQQ